MTAVCPGHEVDELTISLLNIFETRGLSLVLLEALIKQEIDETGMRPDQMIVGQRPRLLTLM
jgi:neurofibromin 1